MTENQTGKTESRRMFLWSLGVLALTWIGAALYPVYRFISPQPAPDVFGADGRAAVEKITPADVAKPGTGKNGGYGGRGLIVLRNLAGELKAFDSKCTHAGCNVNFQGERIYCHCHGGVYDLSGRNIAGPPPKPLTELGVVESDGRLFVFRKSDAKGGQSS